MSESAGDPLAQRLAEGREDAFADLYDQYGLLLYRVAGIILGNRADAEDAMQEVFLGLVRARSKLTGVADLRGYLLTSLRHAAVRLASKRGKATLPLEDAAAVTKDEPRSAEGTSSERLERALHSLPSEQREVVKLKFEAGLTFAEIAELLGISANTAASRYRYAMEKLRALMTKEE